MRTANICTAALFPPLFPCRNVVPPPPPPVKVLHLAFDPRFEAKEEAARLDDTTVKSCAFTLSIYGNVWFHFLFAPRAAKIHGLEIEGTGAVLSIQRFYFLPLKACSFCENVRSE